MRRRTGRERSPMRWRRRAAAALSVLHRQGSRGLGRSYLDGMRHALTTDATHVCQMDADLSHDPAELPRLLDAAGSADLVIGSRYVPGGMLRNWARHRVMLSAFANWYVRAITRLPVHDCTSGFRCWRRELLATGSRSARFDRMATPFRSRRHGKPSVPAAASRKCRSRSSSGARAARRCQAGSSRNQSCCRGGS